MQFFPKLMLCCYREKRVGEGGGLCPAGSLSTSLLPRPWAGVVLDSLLCFRPVFTELLLCALE